MRKSSFILYDLLKESFFLINVFYTKIITSSNRYEDVSSLKFFFVMRAREKKLLSASFE